MLLNVLPEKRIPVLHSGDGEKKVLPPQEAVKEGAGLEGDVQVTSKFGWRDLDGDQKSDFHDGVDLYTRKGADIFSPLGRWKVMDVVDNIKKEGKLNDYSANEGWGNEIIITNLDTNEILQFGHMLYDSVPFKKGEVFEGSQKVGELGSSGNSTGPHVHITYWDGNGEKKSIADSPYADFYDAHEKNQFEDENNPPPPGMEEHAGEGEIIEGTKSTIPLPDNAVITVRPFTFEDDDESYELEDFQNGSALIRVAKDLFNGYNVIVGAKIFDDQNVDDKQLVENFVDVLNVVKNKYPALIASAKDSISATLYYMADFVPFKNVYANLEETLEMAQNGVLMCSGFIAGQDKISSRFDTYIEDLEKIHGKDMAKYILIKAQNLLDTKREFDPRKAIITARASINFTEA